MVFGVLFFASVAIYNSQVTSAAAEGSGFSCEGRVTGYYADVQTGCKTYYYCSGTNQYSYECPNNTLFQQRIFICNHWYLVDCESSELYFDANLLIGQKDKPFVGEEDGGISAPTPTPSGRTTSTYVPLKPRYELPNATTTFEDVISSTVRLESEDIQRVETKEEAKEETEEEKEEKNISEGEKGIVRTGKSNEGEDKDGFIKLIFSDPRGLFYIPNDNNSLESVSPVFREFLIPKISNDLEVMQFKNLVSKGNENVVCPKYCHPRFIKPGTCHPCIMIK